MAFCRFGDENENVYCYEDVNGFISVSVAESYIPKSAYTSDTPSMLSGGFTEWRKENSVAVKHESAGKSYSFPNPHNAIKFLEELKSDGVGFDYSCIERMRDIYKDIDFLFPYCSDTNMIANFLYDMHDEIENGKPEADAMKKFVNEVECLLGIKNEC